jgi:transposase-like protein
MQCVKCGPSAVSERPERTAHGYRRFRCRACGKQFNERAGTGLNRAQYPSDVIALVVLWRLRYKLSLRDLPEMFLIRGIVFSYEAVRDWEAKLTPALAEGLRRHRRGKVGRGWYVDETYIKVHGQWRYLYRAIDRNGALVDVMFSEHRDMAAAKAFFRSAKAVTGVTPERVTTDGHDSYPRAIRVINTVINLQSLVKDKPNVFALGQAVSGPSYPAWAVKKGNAELLALLNDFLAEQRKNGKIAELQVKWFGKSFDDLPVSFAPELLTPARPIIAPSSNCSLSALTDTTGICSGACSRDEPAAAGVAVRPVHLLVDSTG